METLYDYITGRITAYQKPITLEDGWDWSMKEHLRRSFLYINGQFEENNEDRTLRPNKNIVLAIMNVQFRTEGFDVTDVELYVDDPDEYYKSTLSRKYHDKWALENQIDEAIDDSVESYCTYGGVLLRKMKDARPKTVDLRTLAFCNQRNILGHPFGIKHCLGQAELREMEEYGWGKEENGANIDIETLIAMHKKNNKQDDIEIIEVYGVLPSEYLEDEYHEIDNDKRDVLQMQIVSFYKDENNKDVGRTLFKNEIKNINDFFKFFSRDKVNNRALGRGGVEELFEPQVWTNWNEIKITEMLDSASKTLMLTDDPGIASKHKSGLKDLDNLEIIEAGMGKKGLWQLDTYPKNLQVFNNSLQSWNDHAQTVGSAQDVLMGESPTAGTPFKLQELVTSESKGMHSYRRGKLASFWDTVYRDWILPHIKKEIVNDLTFLSEFSADEMIEISQKVIDNKINKKVVDSILDGKVLTRTQVDEMKAKITEDFFKQGNKRFIKILKEDFKDSKLSIKTNIAGRQKNLAQMTDKLVNVLRQYISTPQIRQDPEMNKLLNTILESSGLSPIMFNPTPQAPVAQAGGGTEALKDLAQTNERNTQGQA